MLDVLTFFSPALAFARWVSVHSSAFVAEMVSVSDEVEVILDRVFSEFHSLFPLLLLPLLVSMTFKTFRLLFGPSR